MGRGVEEKNTSAHLYVKRNLGQVPFIHGLKISHFKFLVTSGFWRYTSATYPPRHTTFRLEKVPMKKAVVAVIVPFLCVLVSASTLTTSQAANHVGENATVCGVVSGVHTAMRSRGRPTFVNLDKSYPNQVFTILIWIEDLRKFSPAPQIWDGKRVCATGTISSYRGVPEIVAREKGQISFPK